MTATALQDALTAWERLGGSPKKSGAEWAGYCPIHEADGKGHKPSLTLRQGDKKDVVVNCHAGCDGKEILKALGVNGTARPAAAPVAIYSYRDETGREVRQKLRLEPKDFRIRHRDPATGEWIYKAGPSPAVLYRLPELKAAIAGGRTVFVVEGEKDADRLATFGLEATTNIEGAAQPAQRAKWKAAYTDQLKGAARVVVVPDNDEPGRAHMAHVAQELAGKVGEVRILELPGLPEKGDVSDWLKAGHDADEFAALANKAPKADSGRKPEPRQYEKGQESTKTKAETLLALPTVSRCTHLANSYRIRHYYKARLWYALGLGWIMWTGKFWRPDPTNEGSIATGFIDNLSRLIALESAALSRSAAEESDEDRRKAMMEQAESLIKWAVQSENERTIAAGLKLTKHALLIEYGALNADPWLFNVQNGTIDLRTGTLRLHDPADLITFISPVTYDSGATCPTWERFLSEVFADDLEMVAFIRRAIGWSLTGVVKERALFFLHGHAGKNGKTTMVEAIMKLVGNYGESCYGYGRKVGAETFMKSRNMEDNQRKAATLAGPRFICTSEVDEEHRLNEQLIKDITGGDTIEGRRLYQEAFTFKPQFKPWMYGNHKPEIRGTDDAIWSRVRLIPFEVSFRGREDLELGGKLEAELSGILNWAIEGCLDWQRNGLQPPAKIQAATDEYREEMDVFGPFIRECCVIHRNVEVRANDLWNAYKAWCMENSQREQNQTKFGKYLSSKGFIVERSNGIKRIGIALLDTIHSDSGTVGTVGTVKPESPYSKPPMGTFPPNPSNCSNPSKESEKNTVNNQETGISSHQPDKSPPVDEKNWEDV